MRVIYFDIDTLRPDHLGCYGYSRPTSPHIDSLAANGIRFNKCYAASNPCMPARAAIWTGNYGIKNGVVTHGASALTVNRQGESIARWLREHGVLTASFSSFGQHPAPWFFDGWHSVCDPESRERHFQWVDAGEINREAIPWIERNKDRDFLLHIHYWDPHQPLVAPKEYVNRFVPGPAPVYPTGEMIAEQQSDCFWQCAGMKDIQNQADLQDYLGEYDAEIAFNDAKLGEVVDKLKELGLFEDTLIIISSDHGEEFGEHGCYGEHGNVFEETAHVPLIVHCPKLIAGGQVSDALAYNMDVSGTAVAALGVSLYEKWDTRSVIDFECGKPATGRDMLVFDHGLYTAQRAIRLGDWKLIRTYHPGDRAWPKVMLFNLADDPWEQTDVADTNSQKRDELLGVLAKWERENNVTGTDPLRVTAQEGPFGMEAYGRNFTRAYCERGEKIRVSERKNFKEANNQIKR